jgi:hypothetical protein
VRLSDRPPQQKNFTRLFNMISAVSPKFATAALDRPETFAALTRAHAGLAELRPPRSPSKQSSKISSPPLRALPRDHEPRAAVPSQLRRAAAWPAHPFVIASGSEAIQCGIAVLDCFVASLLGRKWAALGGRNLFIGRHFHPRGSASGRSPTRNDALLISLT